MILKSKELEKKLLSFQLYNENKLTISQLLLVKNYIKIYKKIEELKSYNYQLESIYALNDLFFINEYVSDYLLEQLRKSKSKSDIKKVVNNIKRETDLISAKIKFYKNNIFKFDTDEEIQETLKMYYDEFSARRIIKELYSNKKTKKFVKSKIV